MANAVHRLPISRVAAMTQPQHMVVRWEGEVSAAGGLAFHKKPKIQILCRLLFSNVDKVSKK